MDIGVLLMTAFILAVLCLWTRRITYYLRFQHIPGPKESWLLGNAFQINPAKFHYQLKDWGKTYGPIFKIRLPDTYMIVLSGYEEIREAFNNTGTDLAGRYSNFRFIYLFKDTGLNNRYPSAKWKLLRNVAQKHLKQYGKRMKEMERRVAEVTNDMFVEFRKTADAESALDPLTIIKRTTMKTIALIVCGERLEDDHPLVEALLQFENFVLEVLSNRVDYLLLDLFPFAFNFPLRSSRRLKEADECRDSVARELKRFGLRHENSLMKMLHDCMGDNMQNGSLSEEDVLLTPLSILLGAVGTSSLTFYCLINILAHRNDVQGKIWEEIEATVRADEPVLLEDRSNMPYSRAVIYEVLRYHSLSPFGVPRIAMKDTNILGVRIPEGAAIACNTMALHHDPGFWEEPDKFLPERFLDSAGNLLSADHPHRKHLLPFSSGVRVCPGEQFALARLFLWLTNFIKQFKVTPAGDNDESKIDLKNFTLSVALYPPAYHIRLSSRPQGNVVAAVE